MIALTCPQCKKEIEIDEGFRGGVCRCFNCGTLMTVPDEANGKEPERLSPPPQIEVPEPTAAPVPAAPKTAATVYTTRSGEKVKLSDTQLKKLPVARQRKRTQVYAAVGVGMALLAAALVGGVLWLAYLLFAPPPKEAETVVEDAFEITNNPYTWDRPSFMGLPVTGSSVMVIDSSAAMRDQIDLVKQAVIRSVKVLGADQPTQVVFWTETEPIVFPEALAPAGSIDRNALASKLDEVYASGAPSPQAAFARALAGKPNVVTLVCRTLPEVPVADELAPQIKGAGAKLVIVHLDGIEDDADAIKWKKIAESTGGRYVTLNTGRLRRWYEQVPEEKPAEEAPAP